MPSDAHVRTRLRLELVKGQGSPSYELAPTDPPMTIGRKEGENEFVVRDEQSTVSRRHASIEFTSEGYLLRDMKSRNGVRVHGRPVTEDGVILADGDEIQLGLAALRVRLLPVAAVAAVAAEPASIDEDRTILDAPPPAARLSPLRPPPPAPLPPPTHEPPGPSPSVVPPRAPIAREGSPPARDVIPPPRETPPPAGARDPARAGAPSGTALPSRAPEAPPPPRRPTPEPVPPPLQDDLPVIDQLGPFAIHRSLHASAGLALESATDTRRRRRVLVRRWRGRELGFFGRRRFRRAYEAAIEFRHETVLTPLEAGSTDGDTWVLYPGVDGVTAGMITRAGGRDLRIDLAVYVARETCRAAEALGKAGGPAVAAFVTDHDVIVGRDGSVRLLYVADPGGLPIDGRYAAPEEDAGETRDARSTVFAIGILLYELLVREPIAATHKLTLPSVDTRRIQVGPELAAAVMRALEVRPHERFAHAGDLAHALTRVLDQLAPELKPEQVGAWVASRFAR